MDHFNEQELANGESQRFIRNNKYFTICIYAFVLVIASTIAIRMIVSFRDTRNFFSSLTNALTPFLLALLIAYILSPFVKAVSRLLRYLFKKLPRKANAVLSMLIVYVLALGMIIALLVYVLPQVAANIVDIVGRIPALYDQMLDFLHQMQDRFQDVDISALVNGLENVRSDMMSSVANITASLIPALYNASVSLVSWFANILIAVVVSIYILYGKKSLKRVIKVAITAFCPADYVEPVKRTLVDCSNIFSRYVASKMIDSLIIGALCAVLMTILRLPYVFLISLVVGITNMIPYFGPFIGAIPGSVIILTSSPLKALVFLIMILCLQQFDGLYLGPKLMGTSTGMQPIWIIFAITIGGKLFGVPGMFLGVPMMAILVYLLEKCMRILLRKKNIRMDSIR